MGNNLLDNETLVIEITNIITKARNNVIKNVNNELINAYWNIGRIIVQDELKSERGEYGKKQLLILSKTLTKKVWERIFSSKSPKYEIALYEISNLPDTV